MIQIKPVKSYWFLSIDEDGIIQLTLLGWNTYMAAINDYFNSWLVTDYRIN